MEVSRCAKRWRRLSLDKRQFLLNYQAIILSCGLGGFCPGQTVLNDDVHIISMKIWFHFNQTIGLGQIAVIWLWSQNMGLPPPTQWNGYLCFGNHLIWLDNGIKRKVFNLNNRVGKNCLGTNREIIRYLFTNTQHYLLAIPEECISFLIPLFVLVSLRFISLDYLQSTYNMVLITICLGGSRNPDRLILSVNTDPTTWIHMCWF